MYLEIKLHYDRAFSCHERAITSVALWLKRNFEMMFLDSWDFLIIPENKEDIMIGRLINCGKWNIENYLMKYHGVSINKKKFQPTDKTFLIEIIYEIDSCRPILINDDCLIVGIDNKKKSVYTYTIRDSNLNFVLLDELATGIKEYSTFKIIGEEDRNIDYRHLIEHTKERIINKVTDKKLIFERVKEFAEIFYVAFDYFAERKDAKKFDDMPIISNIIEISRGRRLFSMTLKYISKTCNINIFDDIEIRLKNAESKWLFIMSLLVKSYYSLNFNESTRLKIYRAIKELGEYEKDTFSLLIKKELSIK